MSRRPALTALLLVAALTLAGCASSSSSSTPAAASTTHAQAPPSSAADTAAPPSSSPSGTVCTTHSCIASDAEQLVGNTASDGSVIARMSCQGSTVKHAGPGIWTVGCTATYSDGSRWYGIATVLTSKDEASWQPQYQV